MFEIFAICKAFHQNHFSPIYAHLHNLDPSVLGGRQIETETHFLTLIHIGPRAKKQLCAIWITKKMCFFVKHPKVHCGCPGGFRVQRKAEGNSPHQLFNCRGSDMVWFIGNFVSLFISLFCCNSTSLLKPIFEAWFKFCSQEGPNLNQWSLPEGSKTHLYFRFNVCNHIFWNFLPFLKHYLKTWK